jgi:hypothetical protein
MGPRMHFVFRFDSSVYAGGSTLHTRTISLREAPLVNPTKGSSRRPVSERNHSSLLSHFATPIPYQHEMFTVTSTPLFFFVYVMPVFHQLHLAYSSYC